MFTSPYRHIRYPMVPITHCSDVIMGTITSQITSLTTVYSDVYSDTDQRKYQSPASLTFVRRIHRGPVNSPHKGPVRGKCSHWWRHHDIVHSLHFSQSPDSPGLTSPRKELLYSSQMFSSPTVPHFQFQLFLIKPCVILWRIRNLENAKRKCFHFDKSSRHWLH